MYLNNVRKEKGRRKQQMPACTYGAACNRPKCVYRHPANTAAEPRSESVCVPYLTGECAFGKRCRNRHPTHDEVDKLLQHYAKTPCRWGDSCLNQHCLYFHPDTSKPTQPNQGAVRYLAPTPVSSVMKSQVPKVNVQSSEDFPAPESVFATKPAPPDKSNTSSVTGTANPGSLSASASEFVPSFGAMSLMNTNAMHPVSSSLSATAPAPPTMAERIGAAAVERKQSGISDTQRMTNDTNNYGAREVEQTRRSVRIPSELWVESFRRNPGHYTVQDPVERFHLVNETSKPGVLDLHFQTSSSVISVLDVQLSECQFYEPGELPGTGKVWVVTGTGHHTKQRLQKLSDVVESYLQSRGYRYDYGKDGTGETGAFLVYITNQ